MHAGSVMCTMLTMFWLASFMAPSHCCMSVLGSASIRIPVKVTSCRLGLSLLMPYLAIAVCTPFMPVCSPSTTCGKLACQLLEENLDSMGMPSTETDHGWDHVLSVCNQGRNSLTSKYARVLYWS